MGNITPKEAIANLNHLYGMVSPDIQKSLDVAIKALEKQTTDGDLISRSALKDEVRKHAEYYADRTEEDRYNVGYTECACEVLDFIDNAPTVEPRDNFDLGYVKGLEDAKPKQGEWIEKEDTPASVYYCCSNCDMESLPVTPYCPWCGAEMEGDKR